MKFLQNVVLCVFALALCAAAAAAQTATGGVNGTVTDQHGAVVPGATVTLVNRATNIETRATASEGGYYTFVNVSPGTFNDYPKLGIWSDGYYMTANDFASSFTGAIAVAFERDRMVSGLSAQMVRLGPLPCGTECAFAVLPVHWDGG